MTTELIYTAGVYLSEGISITLTDNRKVSIGSWKEFQSRFINQAELQERAAKAQGIAMICGKVSKGLEVIDIDCKYDTTGQLFNNLIDLLGPLADKLVIVKTQSGGYHMYYRCDTIEGNLKLARRNATQQEKAQNPHVKVLVLIETRGEGGYVVAPPTPGYSFISGNIEDIQTITKEERDLIFEQCRSLNQYLEEPQLQTKIEAEAAFGVSPIDDFNQRGDVVALLNKHGWTTVRSDSERVYLRRPGKDEGTSGDYWITNRWFSVFTTSSEFEPTKAYNPAAVFCKLECSDDWTKCVQKLSSNGYGEDINSFNRRKNIHTYIKKLSANGLDEDTIEEYLIKEKNLKPKAAKKAVQESGSPIQEDGAFWSRNDKGKLEVNKMKMIQWLNSKGFYLISYDETEKDMRLVQIEDYIMEEATTEKVKKCLLQFLVPIDIEVAEWVVNNPHLISDAFLEFIPRIKPEFLEDDINTAYFPFINGIVKITKEKIEMIPYGTLKKHIWKSAKIDFEIEIETTFDENNNISWQPNIDYFPEFIWCISGQDADRWKSAVTFVGYLLHKYKDPTRPYAIIFAEETDNENKGGGTGKGIFASAIGELVKSEPIDGKNFKIDKSFTWQRVGLDTRIIVVQDTKQNTNFELFYSLITEGITIEKKGQPEFYIPYEKSPKFVFTTNYMIPNEGVHAQRRQRVLPFSDFFGAHLTPLEHFGVQFFSGWDNGSWKVFYNFMFMATQVYLLNGLVSMPITDGMRLKGLKGAYGEEFRGWFEDFKTTKLGEWIPFKDLYSFFLMSNDMTEHDYNRKRFKKALVSACEAFGYKLHEDRKSQSGHRRIMIELHRSSVKDTLSV